LSINQNLLFIETVPTRESVAFCCCWAYLIEFKEGVG